MLVLTLALAASQVFATALDTYFQLAIMLMILMMGLTALAHFRPFTNNLLQRMQVHITSSCNSSASSCRCLHESASTLKLSCPALIHLGGGGGRGPCTEEPCFCRFDFDFLPIGVLHFSFEQTLHYQAVTKRMLPMHGAEFAGEPEMPALACTYDGHVIFAIQECTASVAGIVTF